MKITKQILATVDSYYHITIEYNGDNYIYDVKQCEATDVAGTVSKWVSEIHRCVTWMDCGKKLKNSEKKKIKRLINEHFND